MERMGEGTSLKLIVFLSGGGILSLFTGGVDPTTGSLVTYTITLLCFIGAVLAYLGRNVLALCNTAFLLTGLLILVSPRHWSFGGIWLFDFGALISILIASMINLRWKYSIENKEEDTRIDKTNLAEVRRDHDAFFERLARIVDVFEEIYPEENAVIVLDSDGERTEVKSCLIPNEQLLSSNTIKVHSVKTVSKNSELQFLIFPTWPVKQGSRYTVTELSDLVALPVDIVNAALREHGHTPIRDGSLGEFFLGSVLLEESEYWGSYF